MYLMHFFSLCLEQVAAYIQGVACYLYLIRLHFVMLLKRDVEAEA